MSNDFVADLKACPFCGGEPRLSKRYIGYGSVGLGEHDLFSIECETCRAKSSEHRSREQAVVVWNERVCLPESKLISELQGLIEDVNPNEIAAHIADGTLFAWTQTWKMKAHMVTGFLNMTLSKHETDTD